MTTRLSAKPAFTLIELLVVISIIALLIGILLPALGAARKTARIAASASNQRQLGIAMAAYQADSKEYFPLWQQGDQGQMGVAPGESIIWYWTTKLAVDNYIPGLDIYADPSFDGETPFLEEFSFGRAGTGSSVTRLNMNARVFNWIHYGYNYVWVGSNLAESSGTRAAASNRKNTPVYVPARIVDMEDATSVIVTTGVRDWTPADKLTDASTPTPDAGGLYGAHVFIDGPIAISNAGIPHARYNDAIQNAWADGHVSTIKMPFTQQQQDETAVGYTAQPTSKVALFGPNALGNPATWGSSGRGGSDPGNFFDLRGDNPPVD